jgi:hypothetical protein
MPEITKRLQLEPISPASVTTIMNQNDRWLTYSRQRMGFATIRLVPKASVGLRPIMNLSTKPTWPKAWKLPNEKSLGKKPTASLKTTSTSTNSVTPILRHATKTSSSSSGNTSYQPDSLNRKTSSINKVLTPLHEILKYEYRKRPSIGAASSFGYDGMYTGSVHMSYIN